VGASPFPRNLKGDRHEGRIEKLYSNAMVRLSNVSDKDFLKYIVHKMTVWYTRFPPKADPDRKDDDEESRTMARDQPTIAWLGKERAWICLERTTREINTLCSACCLQCSLVVRPGIVCGI
jgi:hypothetical protein